MVTFLIEDCLRLVFFFPVDPEVHPQNEDYWGHVNPIGPRACYDEGKRVAETMCYAYMKQVLNLCQIQWIFCNYEGQMCSKTGICVFRGTRAEENVLSRSIHTAAANFVFFNAKVLLLPSVEFFQMSNVLQENVL